MEWGTRQKINAGILGSIVVIGLFIFLSRNSFGSGSPKLTRTEQKAIAIDQAKHEELLKDLTNEYSRPIKDHKGLQQIAIFEVDNQAVLISSRESPVGIKEKFTMGNQPAVNMSVWSPDQAYQASTTFQKALIPEYGSVTKITPALCTDPEKRKFTYQFIVDMHEYQPSMKTADVDCSDLDGEIVTGKTAIEVKFSVSASGKTFRFQGKYAR